LPPTDLGGALLGSGVAFLFREWLITPSPPGVRTLDVKQELWYRLTVRRHQTHRLADAAIRGLPSFRLLIHELRPAEFVIEQRTDLREPGPGSDLGAEPREIPAGHHELGEEFIAADEVPRALGFTHRPIVSSANGSAAEKFRAHSSFMP
jgi:hypothetical protein